MLELERLRRRAELQIRSAVEHRADVLEIPLDVPQRERHRAILRHRPGRPAPTRTPSPRLEDISALEAERLEPISSTTADIQSPNTSDQNEEPGVCERRICAPPSRRRQTANGARSLRAAALFMASAREQTGGRPGRHFQARSPDGRPHRVIGRPSLQRTHDTSKEQCEADHIDGTDAHDLANDAEHTSSRCDPKRHAHSLNEEEQFRLTGSEDGRLGNTHDEDVVPEDRRSRRCQN